MTSRIVEWSSIGVRDHLPASIKEKEAVAAIADNTLWPNLFLIGVPKAGTTYVSAMLSLHRDIFCSRIKSPNFMNTDVELSDVPLADEIDTDMPLHAAIIRDEQAYLALYAEGKSSPIRVDCSADYLRSTVAAQNIAMKVPNAKIIAILRNPIERCLSHYLMDLWIGRPVGTFETEIERHIAAITANEFWGGNYVRTGFYDEQIERYYARFPEANIKIRLYDDLLREPAALMTEFFRHVDLDPISVTDIDRSRLNVAKLPRFHGVNRLFYYTGAKRAFSRFVPQPLKDRLLPFYYTNRVEHQIPNHIYARLADIFRDHVIELSRILDHDLSPWLVGQPIEPLARDTN